MKSGKNGSTHAILEIKINNHGEILETEIRVSLAVAQSLEKNPTNRNRVLMQAKKKIEKKIGMKIFIVFEKNCWSYNLKKKVTPKDKTY